MKYNKIYLSVLICLNAFVMVADISDPYDFGQIDLKNKNSKYFENALDNVILLQYRSTIPQKMRKLWNKTPQEYKSIMGSIALSAITASIIYRLQNKDLLPAKFQAVQPKDIKVGFDDVIGANTAKKEIKRFLKYIHYPEKFKSIGAEPMQGILLYGPPGTGKTELARATAKEANLPFIHITGSDFNGIWRGSGTNQIEQLVKYANTQKPCIIFIDEIDSAIGRASSQGYSVADDNATTNKFKTVLDGLMKKNSNIFWIGATNNLKDIDPAMIRPGRLQPIEVKTPSKGNIEKMFEWKLYHSKIQAVPNIDVKKITESFCATTGSGKKTGGGKTGADVADLINRAAWIAVENNKDRIEQEDLQKALNEIK